MSSQDDEADHAADKGKKEACTLGCQAPTVVLGGLQTAGCEPVTLQPGRYHAAANDISSILHDFETQLRKSGNEPRSSTEVCLDGVVCPPVGAFPILRHLFKERAYSMIIEAGKFEVERDLFQFICGVCWRFLVGNVKIVQQVGVVFLVYLFFHSQHPGCYSIPVDVAVLETLAELRELCEQKQMFLEITKILHSLATAGAFSVGIRATCRTLYLERRGHMVERIGTEKTGESTASAVKREVDAATELPASRLSVTGSREATGALPSVAAQDGREILNVQNVIETMEEYSAAAPPLEGGAMTTSRLEELGDAASRYQRDVPPEPRHLQMVDALNQDEEEDVVPRRRRARPRSRLHVVHSDSSADSFRDRLPALPLKRRTEEVDDEQKLANGWDCPLPPRVLRCKVTRVSNLVGLEQCLERQGLQPFGDPLMASAPPGPGNPSHAGGACGQPAAPIQHVSEDSHSGTKHNPEGHVDTGLRQAVRRRQGDECEQEGGAQHVKRRRLKRTRRNSSANSKLGVDGGEDSKDFQQGQHDGAVEGFDAEQLAAPLTTRSSAVPESDAMQDKEEHTDYGAEAQMHSHKEDETAQDTHSLKKLKRVGHADNPWKPIGESPGLNQVATSSVSDAAVAASGQSGRHIDHVDASDHPDSDGDVSMGG